MSLCAWPGCSRPHTFWTVNEMAKQSDDCRCGRGDWYQLLHPALDPEVDVPIWVCQHCGDTGRGW